MLALTLTLGVWQVQRLHWKTALLASIDAAEHSPPVPLEPGAPPFARVAVEGTFLPLVARYGVEVRNTPAGTILGAQVISPLARPGLDPLLVDRGWAPLDAAASPPGGPVQAEGYLRPPEHAGWTSAPDAPLERTFYTLDPAAIGRSLGLAQVAPFTLVALGPPGTIPEPASRLPRPPNDHLSYAITWFALAASLVVVFAVYIRQAGRPSTSS